MRAVPTRVLAVAITAVLVVSVSCSPDHEGGDPAPTDGASRPSATGPDPSTSDDPSEPTPVVAGDGQVTSAEYAFARDHDAPAIARLDGSLMEVAPIGSAEELLDHGLASGTWSELEGTVTLLEVVVGERDPATVDWIDDVVHHSVSHVLERAVELLDEDLAPFERQRLEEILSIAMPTRDDPRVVVEPVAELDLTPLREADDDANEADAEDGAIEGGAPEDRRVLADSPILRPDEPVPGAIGAAMIRPVRPVAGVDGSTCLSEEVLTMAQASCWNYIERRNDSGPSTVTLRAHHPEAWDDETRVGLGSVALDAVGETLDLMGPWGATRSVDVWLVERPPRGAWRNRVFAGTNSAFDPCHVYVYPYSADRAVAGDLDEFRFVVAHETVHCLQGDAYEFRRGQAWLREGIADLIATEVVPEYDRSGPVDRFDVRSLTTPLHEMSYETSVFFRFLANESSVRDVWELSQRLSRGDAPDVIVDVLDDAEETFHRFVQQWVQSGVPGVSGRRMAGNAAAIFAYGPIRTTGERGRATSSPFVAQRFMYVYEAAREFEQVETSPERGTTTVSVSSEGAVTSDWVSDVPTGFRTECDERTVLFVVTTSSTGVVDHRVRVDVVEELDEAQCDDCVAGTWWLDLDLFTEAVMGQAIAAGGGLPDGATAYFDGSYLVHFRPDGVVRALRIEFGPVTRIFGATSRSAVDAVERGRYVVLDDTIGFLDYEVVEFRTVFSAPGLGGTMTPGGGTASIWGFTTDTSGAEPERESGDVGYSCDDDRLRIGLPDAGPEIEFRRIALDPFPGSLEELDALR